MKKKFLLLCSALMVLTSCGNNQEPEAVQKKKIQVGIFDGHGGGITSIWEAQAAISIDPEMEATTFTTSDIANGVLDKYDAIFIPGGSGKRQFMNLGEKNQARIREFVAGGKGIVGVCAGAYMLSSTPGYNSIDMNGAMATDIEHDHRGRGIAKYTLNESGKKLFPELAEQDTLYIMYYEGPVYKTNEDSDIKFESFGTMESDVHILNDAPKNMTNNKPAFVANQYGKGRVFASVPHPETTPGMMWMIPRMVRWVLDMPIIKYPEAAVNPNVFGKEILMQEEFLAKEADGLYVFLDGTTEEKLELMDWLQSVNSWEAKRWVQGQLYSDEPSIRAKAAEYIAAINYIYFIKDVEAAYNNEDDSSAKQRIGEALKSLKALIGE